MVSFLGVSPAGLLAQGSAGAKQTAPPPAAPDLSALPKAPKIPTTFEELFTERDRRARQATGYLRCLQSTVTALRAGALGQVPRSWAITCIDQRGEWRGVFGELRDNTIDVRRQYAVRGSSGALTTAPVDTARVSGTARALLRGLAAPLPGKGQYEIVPVPLPQDNFIEVWFVPAGLKDGRAVVGGDSLIQMSADGVRELGHGRSTPPIRTLAAPASGATYELPSLEERIPSVSELMLAHATLERAPEVRVLTRQYESVLRRSTGWTHTKRNPL
ncbi:MAG: hypothetical protein IT353_03930 [Gemmatimonadaceae bacterium]|nr:hypothetical protein [Gemmatimonadaceae bacterium]